MFKPNFGQTNTTTGFGGFTGTPNANPFGQTSVFGKTTTGFAQPAFGAAGTPGLFGNSLSSSGGLFGSSNTAPTFGQAQTTQPSFGFGTTAQPTTNLFGAQQNAGTGLFSSGTGSAFGANKPAFGSAFGTGTTSLFGSQQPAQTTTPLFAQATPSTGTGLFGSPTGTFGAQNQQMGTVIKFSPVNGTDTMIKAGVSQTINTRHFCITTMKEYENKSMEELRFEDYMANRKGPQQGGLFGATPQQPSLFGATTGTSNLFGQQPAENKTLFGGTSTGFGASSSSGGVFGSAPTATNSLFGSKPTGFGTPTTSSPGFGFGATSTNSLFGSTQKPFGATTQTSLFGQPTTQTTTGFGAPMTGGFNAFGTQPNQSIGLFGNKPATSFNMGTTTTTGFSFGSNTATNSNLFGSKPATTGFGAAPGTGFGTFGATNAFGTSTAASTSLFKPTTSNFSFGTTPSSTGLGTTTLGTTNSLFGNPQQKPGGIFGGTTGTGLFGSSFGTGTNTFGNTSMGLGGTSLGGSSLFGNSSLTPAQPSTSTAHPAILALASVPFSDSPLFRNLLPASGKTDSLLKPSNAVTQKAMLACKDLKVSPNNATKIKLKPLAAPLTKKSLFEGLEETDVVSPSFTNTTSSVKKLSLKPKLFNNSVTDSWVENISNKENQLEKTPRRVSFTIPETSSKDGESFYIRRNPLFKPQRHSTLVDLEQTNVPGTRDTDAAEPVATSPDANKSAGTPSTSAQLDDTTKDSSKQSNSSLDETRGFLSDTSRYDEDWQPHPSQITLRRVDYYTIPSLDDLDDLVAEDGSCIVDNFCIGRYGYGNLYFDETMDVAGLNIDEIVHFRHKEVNVYPDDDNKPPVGTELNRKCQVTLEQVWPVDKTSREPIKDPERLLKMKYEEKLRRSTAKMNANFIEYRPHTGSWVFKVDHFSKYGLSDSDDDEPVLNENAMLPGAVKPPAPQPVGQVPKQLPSLPPKTTQTPPSSKKSPSATVLSPILPIKQQCMSLPDRPTSFGFGVPKDAVREKPMFAEGDLGLDADEEMDEEDEGDGDGDDLLEGMEGSVSEHLSPSIHLARRTGIDSHRVQLMKASLFEQEDDFNDMAKYGAVPPAGYTGLEDIHDEHFDAFKLSRGLHTLRSGVKYQIVSKTAAQPFDGKELDMQRPEVPLMSHFIQQTSILRPPRPKTVKVVHAGTVLPFSKSSVGKVTTRCASDSGIFMGRCFRNGWGPFTSLTALTTFWRAGASTQCDIGTSLEGRTVTDNSPSTVQRLYLFNKYAGLRFKDSIEGHLSIQLEHSTKGEEDGCPIIAPEVGVDALHAHCSLACGEEMDSGNEFVTYCRQVWELCVALWGTLPTLCIDDEPLSHKTIMMRKEAVTDWLKKCASSAVQCEVEKVSNDIKNANRHVTAALSFLSGRDIEEACNHLQKQGDHFAAMLLCSGPTSKPLLQDQLSEWQNVSADAHIDPEKLKLFCLSSGLPLFSSTQGVINICENLDWKRAFALHLWYLMSPVSSIADVINKYESAFEGSEPYVLRPYPTYSEEVITSNGKHIYDLCFHLLKLYCFKSHPLEQLLNPATYTSDPLDYRLSWLLEKVLGSLGYVHISQSSSSITCVSFASQLEAYGLWHWSIFVYLHLTEANRRKQAVLETLGRHVTLTEDRELTSEEGFVVDELAVPAEWVYRAKATRARCEFRFHDATYYLIQAGEWNEAHQVIIEHIAADAVINENYDYLRDLLESLTPNSSLISEWHHLGQLLWDYLEVNRVVQQALAEQDIYELESRQAQISSLCTRILRWPCKSAKDRLCQAEIAKRTAHIFHNVMQLHGRMSLADVQNVVSKLPLPEDYLLEELRHVKEAFANT